MSKVSQDADACDTDGDGDYDILVAEDAGVAGKADTFLLNVTQVPDTHAPVLPLIEARTPVTKPGETGLAAFSHSRRI